MTESVETPQRPEIDPAIAVAVQDAGFALLAAMLIGQGKAVTTAAFKTIPTEDTKPILLGVILTTGDLAEEFLEFCRAKGVPVPWKIPSVLSVESPAPSITPG
jgi:hypothetical protein